MVKEKLWTKNFIIITLTNFLIYIVFYLFMVIVAPYAVDRFDASTGTAGLVSGIFVIGILAGRLGTGRIVEEIGSRKILIAGTIFYVITTVLYLSAVNLSLLIIVRFLHGAAYGIASTATGTIVAQSIPGNRRGEGISYYSMSQILATAIGPFLAITLSRHVAFNIIFLISSVIALFGFGISFFISQPGRKPGRPDEVKNKNKFLVSNFLESSAIPISIIILIVGFTYSAILSFISLYSQQIHLEEAASLFFVVYSITVIISRPFSGRLLDAKGTNFVVYPCLLLFAVGMVLFSQTTHGILLLAAGVLIGLGYGNFLSCGHAISIKGAPSDRLGLATATYYMFLDIGFSLGPYLFGLLIPYAGYRGLYFIMALVIFVTIIVYHFLPRMKKGT
ncbi:MAG: MFS transporter [Spirochaetales bacterium]|nr:MFS transporter [Spirochaetales bacterium]